MIMRWLLRLVVLSVAFAVGTALLGWWTVPLLAAIWGVIAHRVPRTGVLAGIAAALAWGALLLKAAGAPSFAALIDAIAGVMQSPPASLIAVTLVFPALLAWSAARVTAVLTTLIRRRAAADTYVTEAERRPVDAGTSSAGERPREVYAAK